MGLTEEIESSDLMVFTCPSGKVIVTGVVSPVGMVMMPSPLLETTVSPAEFENTESKTASDDAAPDVATVDGSLGRAVLLTVDAPVFTVKVA